jgi:vitamin B12 transporter
MLGKVSQNPSILLFFALLFLFSPFSSAAIESEDLEVFSQESRDIRYSDQYFLSSTRSLQKISRVTDNIEIVTREELDRWPVQDLDEALGMINGIVIQDDGNIGQTATAQIYGSKPREVRVMIDGIPMNPTTSGGIADLSQIPLDMVEKIEIIKGAASSVWGSAMGGVINIITRPVGDSWTPHGSATVSFGEFSTQRERGEISGLLGPMRYYGFGSYVESGGFRPNGDELEKRSFLKSEVPLTDELVMAGSFGYSDSKISEFDIPLNNISGKRKVYTRYGNAGLIYSPSEDFHADLFYKISNRTFRRDIKLLPAYTFAQLARTRSAIHEISGTGVWDLTEHQTVVLGSDIGIENFREATVRTTTSTDISKQSTRHAYYANYQLSWRQLDTTVGSRLDATNNYGVYFDPSLGLVLHLPFWESRLKGNVSRAFNAPSLTDRYSSAGTMVANPDLEGEKAVAYNLGVETEPYSWITLHGVFFQTFLSDSIQTITRTDGLRQAVNIDKERRTGFEAGANLGPWYGFSPSYGVTVVYAVDGKGVPLSSRPRFTQDVKLNYHAVLPRGFDLNAHIAGRYMDLVQYGSSGFTPPEDQVFIFDAKIVLTLPTVLYGRVSFFVECENLFNDDFSFDAGRDPNPPRNFEAGAQFRF